MGAGFVLVLGLAAPTLAGEPAGKANYEQYCASCHGSAADGKGPAADSLKGSPIDLRVLGKKYGTPLPKPWLREIVDGREMLRAHGTPEMPVWGEKMLDDVPPSPGREPFKRGTILVILDYLETLQLK